MGATPEPQSNVIPVLETRPADVRESAPLDSQKARGSEQVVSDDRVPIALGCGMPVFLLGAIATVVVYLTRNLADAAVPGVPTVVVLVLLILFVALSRPRNRPAPPTASMAYVIGELSQSQKILRLQSQVGFWISMGMMVAGFSAMLFGAYQLATQATHEGLVTTAAGIVSEAVAAIGVFLFGRATASLERSRNESLKDWRILAALERVQGRAWDASEGDALQLRLIAKFAGIDIMAVEVAPTNAAERKSASPPKS